MTLDELRALGLVETVAARYGTMSFLRTDIYIAQSFGFYREFSQSEVDIWRHFVRPGDNVVTAGANVGAHVLFFARQCAGEDGAPDGLVITAEPQRELYAILELNIAQNLLPNVEAHNVALSSHAGRAIFPAVDYRYAYSFGSIGAAQSVEQSDPKYYSTVELATVDQLVKGRPIRLLHLDVEGAELQALQGARATIGSSRPYLYLECDRPEQREPLFKYLAAQGYELLQHAAPLFNPSNHAGEPRNLFGNLVSISVLGIPKR